MLMGTKVDTVLCTTGEEPKANAKGDLKLRSNHFRSFSFRHNSSYPFFLPPSAERQLVVVRVAFIHWACAAFFAAVLALPRGRVGGE